MDETTLDMAREWVAEHCPELDGAAYDAAVLEAGLDILRGEAEALAHEIGCTYSVDADGPDGAIGIWLHDGVTSANDNLIGAGDTEADALADAIVTMCKWAQS